nr:dpy-20 protein - Caenorhabditis elegans [Caenorhabditis elegans]
MEGHSNTSVILHTYQQQQPQQLISSIIPQTLSDGYGISAPISQADCSGNSNFVNTNPWNNTTFQAYQTDAQFTNEISVLNYPNVYDDFSKESSNGILSDPSLHGSHRTSSTSDVGSSVDCSISPEPILMPSVKRGRPTENPCWAYFHRIDDQLVKCRLCTKVVRSACATNMTKHLERHHADDYQKVTGQLKLFRMNDIGIRSKMHYEVADNPLSTLPVVTNSYIFTKNGTNGHIRSLSILWNATRPNINQQQFIQFEQPQASIDPQTWPLTHFWQNTAQTNIMSHLGEASTSTLGSSVIQEAHKMNPDSNDKSFQLDLEQQNCVIIEQKLDDKPRVTKPTTKPYQKRNRSVFSQFGSLF